MTVPLYFAHRVFPRLPAQGFVAKRDVCSECEQPVWVQGLAEGRRIICWSCAGDRHRDDYEMSAA